MAAFWFSDRKFFHVPADYKNSNAVYLHDLRHFAQAGS